jgi:hypothetical protein
MNGVDWLRLEHAIGDLANAVLTDDGPTIFLLTGPVFFENQQRYLGSIPIPAQLFKVIKYCEDTECMQSWSAGFLMDNAPQGVAHPLTYYQVHDLSEIESMTGLDLSAMAGDRDLCMHPNFDCDTNNMTPVSLVWRAYAWINLSRSIAQLRSSLHRAFVGKFALVRYDMNKKEINKNMVHFCRVTQERLMVLGVTDLKLLFDKQQIDWRNLMNLLRHHSCPKDTPEANNAAMLLANVH